MNEFLADISCYPNCENTAWTVDFHLCEIKMLKKYRKFSLVAINYYH